METTVTKSSVPFPAAGHEAVKDRVNAIALPTVEDIRRDSDLFLEGVRSPEYQDRMQAAMNSGFQTRDAEMNLARMLVNTPPAEKPPAQLAARARAIAEQAGFTAEVWDAERIERERFGGLLGVSAGSDQPPATFRNPPRF